MRKHTGKALALTMPSCELRSTDRANGTTDAEQARAPVGSLPLPVASTAKSTAAARAVATGSLSEARAVATVVAKRAGRRACLLLLVGIGHDCLGEVKVLAKVSNALVGQEPVVVLPRVGALNIPTGAGSGSGKKWQAREARDKQQICESLSMP